MDRLIEKIIKTQNPTCVGLDTRLEYIPAEFLNEIGEKGETLASAARAILEFNKRIIDAVADIVPSVKIQIAYYEMYGTAGINVFARTAEYAAQNGLYVISDIKRNDIGATAEAYSTAYIGKTPLANDTFQTAYVSDSVTVNGYLGTDGITPFVKNCVSNDKTIFVLVKTSNPSSGELQDLELANGKKVYEQMADMVEQWGSTSIGKYGYSAVGAVVGATYPEQGKELRARMKNTFFLIPGYGAQGGSADGLAGCFDENGLGGVVNASRSILCAYKKDAYKGMAFDEAARAEAIRMKEDLARAINAHSGKAMMGE